jgi:hypothetical protein
LPQYLLPAGGVAIEEGDLPAMKSCLVAIEFLTAGQAEIPELLQLLQMSLVLAIATARDSPDFDARFGELKAKLQYASLLTPLLPSPILPQFPADIENERQRFVLQQTQATKQKWLNDEIPEARQLLARIENHYPGCWTLPQYLLVAGGVAIEEGDMRLMEASLSRLTDRMAGMEHVPELLLVLKSCLELALSDRGHRDFVHLFPHLKARLQHANLVA